MFAYLKALLGRLGRVEKVFLVLLPFYVVARFASPGSTAEVLLAIVVYFTGAAVVYRLVRAGLKKTIWRLRNRLLVVYVFIAVVPIALLVGLVGIGVWILTGQIAMHMVTAELEERAHALLGPAQSQIRAITPYYRRRFPGLELLARDGGEWRDPKEASITAPPEGWREASGLISKGGDLYVWAHSIRAGAETTLMAPLTGDVLAELVPNLGEVSFLREEVASPGASRRRRGPVRVVVSGKELSLPELARGQKDRLPPPANQLDREVMYISPVPVAVWESPGAMEKRVLIIRTRYSAVLRTIFGQTVEFTEGFTMASLASFVFVGAAALFFVFELVSLIIGIRLTRTITGAVHNLYEGTQKVREGDFSHRIEVHGNDQLADLSDSFNRMTENLERLVEVAKEKERLQSELEIAREVQNQLYPKSMPVSRTLELTAVCRPARMVSGDYYDFLSLEAPKLALAIGDVAGKGISAALLMATVQSTMRAQLRAGREMAATVGNGGPGSFFSTAAMVSRLNQQLYAYTPPEKFATFFFAVYDDLTGLMTYTNAGHLPPIRLRNGTPQRLEVTGMIVGAFPFSTYEESSIQLEGGDLLVCFTDGLTEPENEYGEMFGEERLIELVLKNSNREAEEIIASVMDSVGEWTGSPELQDDMTMLIARRS
jgi:sigma-B regulation protein RsbU (phosphoserine phosphatase)